MKKIISKILIFLGLFSMIIGTITVLATEPSYAKNLEVIGKEIGLEVNPKGNKLFNLTNLNPGDTHQAKIDIKNKYTDLFRVFMRTERITMKPGLGEVDLFEQLILTIYLDNIKIYSGPMKNYALRNISLGDFPVNSEKELRALVHLPGPKTGNEFQGKSIEVKWIFIAEIGQDVIAEDGPRPPKAKKTKETEETEESNEGEEVEDDILPEDIPEMPEKKISKDKPIIPKTGQVSAAIYYGTGSVLLILGLLLRRKK